VRCRLDLSALAEAAGDSAAALRLARDAAAMQTQAAPHPAFGEAQVRVAELHRRAGQWSEARDAYAGALALYTRLGQQEASARCAKGLGHIERLLSRHAESRRAYLLALAGFTSSGDAHQAAQCQMHIGWLAAQAGEHRDAERWFLRALQALQQSEDTLRVGLVYAFLARVAQAIGDKDLRQRRLGEAIRLDAMRPLSVPEWPRTLEAIASAQVVEGDIESARAGLRRALQVWQFLGSTQDEARVRGRLSALDAPRP
jgi:tetratricopeptide (TPR) repeat protein